MDCLRIRLTGDVQRAVRTSNGKPMAFQNKLIARLLLLKHEVTKIQGEYKGSSDLSRQVVGSNLCQGTGHTDRFSSCSSSVATGQYFKLYSFCPLSSPLQFTALSRTWQQCSIHLRWLWMSDWVCHTKVAMSPGYVFYGDGEVYNSD